MIISGKIIGPASFMVAISCSDRGRPCLFDTKISSKNYTCFIRTWNNYFCSLIIHQHEFNTRHWIGCPSCFSWRDARHIGDHDATSFCLKPSVYNGTFIFTNLFVVPIPSFLVNGFANRTQYF